MQFQTLFDADSASAKRLDAFIEELEPMFTGPAAKRDRSDAQDSIAAA